MITCPCASVATVCAIPKRSRCINVEVSPEGSDSRMRSIAMPSLIWPHRVDGETARSRFPLDAGVPEPPRALIGALDRYGHGVVRDQFPNLRQCCPAPRANERRSAPGRTGLPVLGINDDCLADSFVVSRRGYQQLTVVHTDVFKNIAERDTDSDPIEFLSLHPPCSGPSPSKLSMMASATAMNVTRPSDQQSWHPAQFCICEFVGPAKLTLIALDLQLDTVLPSQRCAGSGKNASTFISPLSAVQESKETPVVTSSLRPHVRSVLQPRG